VAHFALEMGAKDEVPLYYLMHCRNKYGAKGFNKKAFNKGELSEEAEDMFYRSINSKSLKEDLPGEIFYRQRGSMTWFELARELDDLIEQHGISMAFVDYLTLVEVMAKGNQREAVDRMIQSVKPFCESRNLLLVSPVQGNREGLDRCVDNEGQWDPQGIDTYSGYFRAMDGIIGVYSPKEPSNRMILSAVKNRHDVYPDPYTVNVCEETGFIYA
jgi:replicative DNA helicase